MQIHKYNRFFSNDNETLFLCLLFYYLSIAHFTYISVMFDFQVWFLMAVPDWRPTIPLVRQKICKGECKNSCQKSQNNIWILCSALDLLLAKLLTNYWRLLGCADDLLNLAYCLFT